MLFTLRQKKVTTNLFARVSFAGLLNLATSDAELCTNVVTVICSSIFLNRIIEASKYSRYGFRSISELRLGCRIPCRLASVYFACLVFCVCFSLAFWKTLAVAFAFSVVGSKGTLILVALALVLLMLPNRLLLILAPILCAFSFGVS